MPLDFAGRPNVIDHLFLDVTDTVPVAEQFVAK